MDLKDKRIGVALTGSYCTFSKVFEAIEEISKCGADIYPIMSENVYNTNTRFGNANDFSNRLERISGKKIIKSIYEAEPIGPRKMFDLLIVIPCTGNTLAKLATGIADTSVTLAVKAHLRNERPVLIGISTNDGLLTAHKNIGLLCSYKNYYMIPYTQDDINEKHNSIVSDFSQTVKAAECALDRHQLQPVLV